eukprot:44342_1
MAAGKPPDLWVVWLVLVVVIILIIVAIYGTIKLYQCRMDPFMKKRSISIVFGLNISTILGMISNFCNIYFQYTKQPHAMITSVGIFFGCWFSIFFFLNVKNWIIHNRYKWQYFTLQLKWQRIINPNIVEIAHKNNWYIRNNYKYGNLYNIYKRFAMLHSLNFIIGVTLLVIRMEKVLTPKSNLMVASGVIAMVNFLLPWLIYIIIVCSTPSFNDIFFIHWESKIHAVLSIFIVMPYTAANLIISIHGFVTPTHTLIFSVTRICCFFALVVVSTFVIQRKNKKYHSTKIGAEIQSDKKLEDVLSNGRTLNLFMNHLSKEFSMECLCSFIELSQFQKYVLKQMNENINSDEKPQVSDIKLINFPSNVPTSIIIEEHEEKNNIPIQNIKNKAYNLYVKYIKMGAELEINISGMMRDELIDTLDDKNKLMNDNTMNLKELLLIFNDAKEEMMHIMKIAFVRFLDEPEAHSSKSIIEFAKKK